MKWNLKEILYGSVIITMLTFGIILMIESFK
jgi:hypothetical protein